VVWEKVLDTDLMSPNTRALMRVSDKRARQFWDHGRLLSHAMGEDKTGKPVWDWAGLYPKEAAWNGLPPKPQVDGRTIVRVADDLDKALAHL